MIQALQTLGVGIERSPGDGRYGDDLIVTPVWPLRGGTVVDSGQAGTVMRFVAGLAGFARGDVTITADESALHRPMGTMIKALRDVGVDIDDGGHWALPFTVRGHGHVRGGEVVVDASASSQFVSGLLLAAPRFDVGLRLVHRGERLPSMPHIDMTIEALAHRGVHVERPAPGEWVVPAGAVRAKDVAIEPDLSNAAPFLAAAMIAGGSVSVDRLAGALDPTGLHADRDPHADGRPGRATRRRAHRHGRPLDRRHPPGSVRRRRAHPHPRRARGVRRLGEHVLRASGISAVTRPTASRRWSASCAPWVAKPTSSRTASASCRAHCTAGLWRAHHDHRLATTGALIGLRSRGRRGRRHRHDREDACRSFRSCWQEMLAGTPDDARAEPLHNLAS